MKPFSQQRSRMAGWSALTVVVALALAGCSEKIPADVLAKVGTHEIRTADLQREAERRRKLGRGVPEKKALLQEMVQYEALIQRAKSAGLDKDPQVARELGNLLVAKLLEQEVTTQLEKVTVTDEEVRAEFEKNRAKYTEPAKVRLAVLFLEASANSSETKRTETRARLAEGLRKFKESPPTLTRHPTTQAFGSLAVQYSDDQASRHRGGDLGWMNAGEFNQRWPKPVLAAGYALEKGHVSDIIQTDTGFYAVMKTDLRAATERSLQESEAALRRQLLTAKRTQLDEKFRQDTEQMAGVTLHEKALATVELPKPGHALARTGEVRRPDFPVTAPVPGGQR